MSESVTDDIRAGNVAQRQEMAVAGVIGWLEATRDLYAKSPRDIAHVPSIDRLLGDLYDAWPRLAEELRPALEKERNRNA